MALIGEKDQQKIRELFEERMDGPVTLVLFTHDHDSPAYRECQFCDEVEELVREIAGLSDLVDVVVYTYDEDEETVEKYGVRRAPVTCIVGEKDYGIRYYGIPSGYEAGSFIEDIMDVSTGETELSEDTRQWLERLDKPVHLQVFVTPT